MTRGKASNGIFIIESMHVSFFCFLPWSHKHRPDYKIIKKKPFEAFLGVIEHRLDHKIIKMPFEVNHRFPAS
jgi:hypothetical protein